MTTRVSRRTIAAFLGPAVAALALEGIAPLLYAVWKSLHDFNLTKIAQQRFVGLENYAALLTDPVFWQAMRRTGVLFLIAVPIQIALGLLIALVLHGLGLSFWKTLKRLSLVLRMATTYAVVGLRAQVMLNQKYGVINQILGWVGVEAISFLGDPTNAFIAVILRDIWQWPPCVALVLLAGQSTVPPEIEEAAKPETKSNLMLSRHVQLPFLIPSLVAVLIERVGNRQFDIGMAAAQSIIMLAITIVLARLYIRLFYREVR